MKGTKGSYKEKGFTMDENMVQNETMDDVVETDAEIIDNTDEGGVNPWLVAVGVAGTIGAVVYTQRKRLANVWDKHQEKRWQKWCEKTGRSYVVVEPAPNETDTEN